MPKKALGTSRECRVVPCIFPEFSHALFWSPGNSPQAQQQQHNVTSCTSTEIDDYRTSPQSCPIGTSRNLDLCPQKSALILNVVFCTLDAGELDAQSMPEAYAVDFHQPSIYGHPSQLTTRSRDPEMQFAGFGTSRKSRVVPCASPNIDIVVLCSPPVNHEEIV